MFNLHDFSVSSTLIDTDIQLAAIGLINKIIDLLVTMALERGASLMLTFWMISPAAAARVPDGHEGATLLDFELSEELKKFWVCVWNYRKRIRTYGWSGLGWLGHVRFLLCLFSSVGILFVGLGLNTVTIPKMRLYPDIGVVWRTNQITFSNISWATDLAQSMALANSSATTNLPEALAESMTLVVEAGEMLTSLRAASFVLSQQPPGWLPLYNDAEPVFVHADPQAELWDNSEQGKNYERFITVLETDINSDLNAAGTARSLSIHKQDVMKMWTDFEHTSTANAKAASGLEAFFNLTSIVLDTTCNIEDTSATLGTSAIEIRASPNESLPGATGSESALVLQVLLGPIINSTAIMAEDGFPGAVCTILVSQHLIPVFGVVKDRRLSWARAFWFMQDYTQLSPEPSSNSAITDALTDRLTRLVPILQASFPGQGVVPLVVAMYRSAQDQRPDLDEGDNSVLSFLIASMVQTVVSLADWEAVVDPQTQVTHSVRLWLYASSPRLPWEWGAVFFIIICLVAVAWSLCVQLWFWMAPGPWVEMGGMLVVANRATELDVVKLVDSGSSTSTLDSVQGDCRDRYGVGMNGGKVVLLQV